MARAASAALGLVFVLVTTAPSSSQTCNPGVGSWAGPFDWGAQINVSGCPGELEFSHAALLPKGPYRDLVLLWRNETIPASDPQNPCKRGDTGIFYVFDPDSTASLFAFRQQLSTDIFCAGQTWDKSGNLLVAGGVPSACENVSCTNPCQFPTETYRLRPQNIVNMATSEPYPALKDPWKKLGDMTIRRYYPTVITLLMDPVYHSVGYTPAPSGTLPGTSTLVAGGPPFGGAEGNEYWELMPPPGTGSANWFDPFIPSNPDQPDQNWGGQNSPNYSVCSGTYQPANYDGYERPSGPGPLPPANRLFSTYPRMFQTSENGEILVEGDVDDVGQTNLPGTTWVIKPRMSTAQGLPSHWGLYNAPLGVAPPPLPGTLSRPWRDSFYDTAVLLHKAGLGSANKDRVILFGGSREDTLDTTPVTTTRRVNEEVWEFEKGSGLLGPIVQGSWTLKNIDPDFQRLYPNSVILPTGDIFLEGGTSTDDAGTSAPVYESIIFDPGSGASDPGVIFPQTLPNPMTVGGLPAARLYHHIAVLLPDGRVFVAGGKRATNGMGGYLSPDPRYSGEVFSPPYLDTANVPSRPVFDENAPPPTQLTFNGPDFTLDVVRYTEQFTGGIDAVVLLRPAALTHHWDGDQRYIELAFSSIQLGPEGAGFKERLTVQSPDKEWGPQGYYMLFVVDKDTSCGPIPPEGHRVPSIGEFVNIQ